VREWLSIFAESALSRCARGSIGPTPLTDARGSEALILNHDREGVVPKPAAY
jgi:hypothetical protein